MKHLNLVKSNFKQQIQTGMSIQTTDYKFVLTNILKNRLTGIAVLVFLLFLQSFNVQSQDKQAVIPRDTLIKAARDIITGSPYCALITVDSKGLPHVRTMNPFPLGDEIIIWFATSRKSRKVGEIKKNPNVCVYYSNHTAVKGYVSINGKAEIIDNKELLVKMKRDYWNGIPNWQENFVLIKITPKTMDVINYEKGVNSKSDTNRSPFVEF